MNFLFILSGPKTHYVAQTCTLRTPRPPTLDFGVLGAIGLSHDTQLKELLMAFLVTINLTCHVRMISSFLSATWH